MEPLGKDRRAFERFAARFPTRFKDGRNDYGTTVALRDASAQGARILSRDKMSIHDPVDIEIKLPDSSDPVELSGEVVWVRQAEASIWDIGVKFSIPQFMRLSRLYKFA